MLSGEMKLVADRVCKRYTRGAEPELLALAEASLEVDPGEFVSVVGPSGCGKTTLLRVLGGLVPPTSGTVALGGTAVTEPSSRISFVFQSASLLPWRSVMQNILLAAKFRGELSGDSQERAEQVLELVGLDGFEDKFPYELSGGMQQRANLARALFVDADILLMDEPFGALDAMTRQIMQLELLRITEGTRRSVVFVTHSLEEAVLLSDRVVVMTRRPGRIKRVVTIDFPRPRSPDIHQDPRFAALVAEMWASIEKQAREAV